MVPVAYKGWFDVWQLPLDSAGCSALTHHRFIFPSPHPCGYHFTRLSVSSGADRHNSSGPHPFSNSDEDSLVLITALIELQSNARSMADNIELLFAFPARAFLDPIFAAPKERNRVDFKWKEWSRTGYWVSSDYSTGWQVEPCGGRAVGLQETRDSESTSFRILDFNSYRIWRLQSAESLPFTVATTLDERRTVPCLAFKRPLESTLPCMIYQSGEWFKYKKFFVNERQFVGVRVRFVTFPLFDL